MSEATRQRPRGYVQLIDAFLAGVIEATAFSQAFIELWRAEVDAASSQLRPPARSADQLPSGEELLRGVARGDVTPEEFGHAWCALWREVAQDDQIQAILDELHHFAYFLSENHETVLQDPDYYCTKEDLISAAKKARLALRELE